MRSSGGPDLPAHVLSGDALEYGARFGNTHGRLTTQGKGSIQQFFSIDTGSVLAGSVSIVSATIAAGGFRLFSFESG